MPSTRWNSGSHHAAELSIDGLGARIHVYGRHMSALNHTGNFATGRGGDTTPDPPQPV